MELSFARGAWNMEGLVYANSYRWADVPAFTQEDDCIVNGKTTSLTTGYENVSLMLKEPLSGDTHIVLRTSFDAWGAPLLVLAEDLAPDEEGKYRYREYYEVVLYEEGINVWRLTTDEDNTVSWRKAMSVDFPVSCGEIHTLTVDVIGDTLEITADEHRMSLLLPDLFQRYYVGIDACENINRFYSLTVSPIRKEMPDYICSFCGYAHSGATPPDRCPDCGVGPERFMPTQGES